MIETSNNNTINSQLSEQDLDLIFMSSTGAASTSSTSTSQCPMMIPLQPTLSNVTKSDLVSFSDKFDTATATAAPAGLLPSSNLVDLEVLVSSSTSTTTNATNTTAVVLPTGAAEIDHADTNNNNIVTASSSSSSSSGSVSSSSMSSPFDTVNTANQLMFASTDAMIESSDVATTNTNASDAVQRDHVTAGVTGANTDVLIMTAVDEANRADESSDDHDNKQSNNNNNEIISNPLQHDVEFHMHDDRFV